MDYTIISKKIFTENDIQHGSIFVKDGKICEVGSGEQIRGRLIDLTGYRALPGLIDIHVHGGNGYDAMSESADALNKISLYKLAEGVTSFCPTTATASLERTRQALKNTKSAMANGVDGARVIGAFLEGPYISVKYKGAHSEDFIREISIPELDELIAAGDGAVKSIAIAHEKPGAMEAIEHLKKNNVNVRIGHSAASCQQTFEAVGNGANIAIHMYNAMSPLNHRDPGMVGAVLTDDRIYSELICDFVHVHKTAIDVVIRAKGCSKIILVTDCLMSGGLSDGSYELGELKVIVKDNVARTESGALAGSSLKLITAVKNIHEICGAPLISAVNMASVNPARALGIDSETGSISAGKRADIIAIDDDFNVVFAMVDGDVKFNNIRG